MAYSSLAVANYFLQLARESGEALTPMKLQKLVYYAHGWHLAVCGEALVNESVQAWKFGPVIPSVYHEFKKYGLEPVSAPAMKRNFLRSLTGEPYSLERDGSTRDPDETRRLVDRVWQVFQPYSGVQLSNMTHEPGSPWDIVWRQCGGARNTPIPDSLIQEYFERLAERDADR